MSLGNMADIPVLQKPKKYGMEFELYEASLTCISLLIRQKISFLHPTTAKKSQRLNHFGIAAVQF